MRIPDDDGSDSALPQYTLLFYSILFSRLDFPFFAVFAHANFAICLSSEASKKEHANFEV